MRGGKIKLKPYNNFKTEYGSLDKQNPKSIYIKTTIWCCVLSDERWDKIISTMRKIILRKFNEINEHFHDRIIVDLDIRESGLCVGKRSFMSIELMLFQRENLHKLNSDKIKTTIDSLVHAYIDEFNDRINCFSFHQTKN